MASSLFERSPHPRTIAVLEGTTVPIIVNGQRKRDSAINRFNAALAVSITNGIGSMWCAYIFALIALVGLPAAINDGTSGIVQWIAQTFLQLVLLSIIIVGQNIQAEASDRRAEGTYKDVEAMMHEVNEIQKHLDAQDAVLAKLLANQSS